MSSPVETLIIQSSKSGIDQTYGTDYEILFNRAQIVKSDKIHKVVDAVYDKINFAKTVEPRLRRYLVADSLVGKYKIASQSSINGKTYSYLTTSRQEHSVKQENVQRKPKGLGDLLGGGNNNQSPGGQAE